MIDLIYRHWTKTAIDCYSIGCRCSICPLRKIMETKCQMKKTVIAIVRNIGKPELDFEIEDAER